MNKPKKRSGEIAPLIERRCDKCRATFKASAQVHLCRECGAEMTDR